MSGGPLSPDETVSARPAQTYALAAHRGDLTGDVVATTRTDSSGAFGIDLSPGTYTLSEAVVTTMGGVSPQTVTVAPHRYVNVTLVINVP
jgi:hypothetical protein